MATTTTAIDANGMPVAAKNATTTTPNKSKKYLISKSNYDDKPVLTNAEWMGRIPGVHCDLLVSNVPVAFTHDILWTTFERYGRVYSISMRKWPSKVDKPCFGTIVVRFATEKDAIVCKEILSHCLVQPNHRMVIQRLFDPTRVMVLGLPRNEAIRDLRIKFRAIFPNFSNFTILTCGCPYDGSDLVDTDIKVDRVINKGKHRGYGFLEFTTNSELRAAVTCSKKHLMDIFGPNTTLRAIPPLPVENQPNIYQRQLHIPDISYDNWCSTKAYFNSLVGEEQIISLVLTRQSGELTVASKKVAQEVLEKVAEETEEEFPLQLTLLPQQNTPEFRYALCKSFELACIANCWSKPVIIFGRVFPERHQQYAACFTTFMGRPFAIFLKVMLDEQMDMTSRIAEVYLALIEETGYLPPYHYCIDLSHNEARVVGFIQDLRTGTFIRTFKTKETNGFFYWNEMLELSWAVHKLSQFDPSWLFQEYQMSQDNPIAFNENEEEDLKYFLGDISTNNRLFICAFNNHTDMILLLLCDKFTCSNFEYLGQEPVSCSTFKATMCFAKHPEILELSLLEGTDENQG